MKDRTVNEPRRDCSKAFKFATVAVLSCSTNLVAAVPADAFAVAAAGDDGVLAGNAAAAVGAEVDAADVAEAAIVVAAGDYPIVHC